MNANRQLTIDRIIALHLRIECPPTKCLDPSRRQFTMLTRFQYHNGNLGMFRNQQASLHPIIDLLSVERRGNRGPGRRSCHRTQLLILIEWKSMDMDFRQFKHVFVVIALMRGFVADCGIKQSRPRQDNSKEQSINWSHKFSFYAINNRMLKRAIPFHPPPRAKTGITPKGRRLPLKTSKILHQMPNRVIQQGRREPAD